MMKRAYFMTEINDVFCMGHTCDKQMRDAFHSSCLTGVIWAAATLRSSW